MSIEFQPHCSTYRWEKGASDATLEGKIQQPKLKGRLRLLHKTGNERWFVSISCDIASCSIASRSECTLCNNERVKRLWEPVVQNSVTFLPWNVGILIIEKSSLKPVAPFNVRDARVRRLRSRDASQIRWPSPSASPVPNYTNALFFRPIFLFPYLKWSRVSPFPLESTQPPRRVSDLPRCVRSPLRRTNICSDFDNKAKAWRW